MTASHRDALRDMLPQTSSAGANIELLDPEGQDVPDPFGGPLQIYRKTAAAIESFVNARLDEWI